MELLSRDEYLARRKAWKDEYKELALFIRDLKVVERLAARGGYAAVRRFQSMRAKKSTYARRMMEILEELKENSRTAVAFQRWCEQQNY